MGVTNSSILFWNNKYSAYPIDGTNSFQLFREKGKKRILKKFFSIF